MAPTTVFRLIIEAISQYSNLILVDAEDRVQVEVANGVVLTLHRQAIATFLDKDAAAPAAADEPAAPCNATETPEESLRRLNDEGKDERNA